MQLKSWQLKIFWDKGIQWLGYHLPWEWQKSVWMKYKLISVGDCVVDPNYSLPLSIRELDIHPLLMWLVKTPCETSIFPTSLMSGLAWDLLWPMESEQTWHDNPSEHSFHYLALLFFFFASAMTLVCSK